MRMIHQRLIARTACWVVLICVAGSGLAQDAELAVLPENADRPRTEEMMRSYLRGLANEALDRRMERYEKLTTPEEIAAYQRAMRRFFLEQLGGFPERTPLNAQVVGKKSYSDYRIEKVIYESQPGFHVPAILYLPKTEGPYPGVLLLCGHTENGKAGYQQVAIFMVKNGMAVLCPDPIGQGERKQILDDKGAGAYRATTEHMITGIGPIALGRNLATYMIFDAIRGLDYLVSRPEIDASRIGCTGNSGGGNRTAYLTALDDRIAASAPGCFITTTRRKNEKPGPGDAEQNIHAQIARGMDHADYIMMRAPRPALILGATGDFVPIEGAWESFRQAKRLYARLGYAERVDLAEADEKHGYSLQLRIAAVRWMRRWLMNIDDAVTEGEFSVEPDEELRCTPGGQVLLTTGARSIFDLNVEVEQRLAAERKRLWSQSGPEAIRAKIREVTKIRKLADLPKPKVEARGSVKREGFLVDKLVLRWEAGIELPALKFRPHDGGGDLCLYLHGQGKHADAAPGGPIEKLVRAGHTVLAIDLRGSGETRTTPWRYKNSLEFCGDNVAEYFIAYMLDKSFLGMRAEDALVAGRFLSERSASGEARRVRVIAVGEAGPAALHAVALEPSVFSSLTLRRSLVSWSDVVRTPVTKGALVNVVHGALRSHDLPDLVSLVGDDQVTIEDPACAGGQALAR